MGRRSKTDSRQTGLLSQAKPKSGIADEEELPTLRRNVSYRLVDKKPFTKRVESAWNKTATCGTRFGEFHDNYQRRMLAFASELLKD